MALSAREAKAQAVEQLRGKNAKPSDVNRLTQKLMASKGETRAQTVYEGAPGIAQANDKSLVEHGPNGGTWRYVPQYDYTYHTDESGHTSQPMKGNRLPGKSDLTNYIDKVLEQGGLRDVPSKGKDTPAAVTGGGPGGGTQTGQAESDPGAASTAVADQGGNEDEKTVKSTLLSGVPIEKIAAGAAGIAAMYALYRMGKKYGGDPNKIKAAIDATEAEPSKTAAEPFVPGDNKSPIQQEGRDIAIRRTSEPAVVPPKGPQALVPTDGPDAAVNPEEQKLIAGSDSPRGLPAPDDMAALPAPPEQKLLAAPEGAAIPMPDQTGDIRLPDQSQPPPDEAQPKYGAAVTDEISKQVGDVAPELQPETPQIRAQPKQIDPRIASSLLHMPPRQALLQMRQMQFDEDTIAKFMQVLLKMNASRVIHP